MATQLGTLMAVGAETTITIPDADHYILVSAKQGDRELDVDKIDDNEGALATIITYNTFARITLNMLAKTGATPAATFPKGTQVDGTAGGLWFVEDCAVDADRSPTKVTVTLVNYNLT
ncbi:MAG: hypothetical protein ABIH03_17155 [Pseudomonadota bacterium]